MKKTFGFSRKGPDRVAEELAAVLSKKTSYEFKALFLIVHANLRERKAAGGGEDMLRLRAYEKLQVFVRAGYVKKTGKEYQGVAPALATFLKAAAEMAASVASVQRSAASVRELAAAKAAPTRKVRRAS